MSLWSKLKSRLGLSGVGALVGCVILAIGAVVLVGIGVPEQIRYGGATAATGKIIDTTTVRSNNRNSHTNTTKTFYYVAYTDAAGIPHQVRAAAADSSRYRYGDKVDLRYDPDDPNWVVVGGSWFSGHLIAALTLLGVIALPGGYIWWTYRKTRPKRPIRQ